MIDAKRITSTLINRRSPANLKQNFAVIPNVSWGFFEWGEADILAISKSRYLTEIEVKVSVNDLKADFKKLKWAEHFFPIWKSQIKRFYYAVPSDMVDEALEVVLKHRPEAGLLSIELRKTSYYVEVRKECIDNKTAKISDADLIKLVRLASFRLWRNL